MPSTTTELERLIIRLVGDGSSYKQTLDDAVKQTTIAVAKIGSMVMGPATQKNAGLREKSQRTSPK